MDLMDKVQFYDRHLPMVLEYVGMDWLFEAGLQTHLLPTHVLVLDVDGDFDARWHDQFAAFSPTTMAPFTEAAALYAATPATEKPALRERLAAAHDRIIRFLKALCVAFAYVRFEYLQRRGFTVLHTFFAGARYVAVRVRTRDPVTFAWSEDRGEARPFWPIGRAGPTVTDALAAATILRHLRDEDPDVAEALVAALRTKAAAKRGPSAAAVPEGLPAPVDLWAGLDVDAPPLAGLFDRRKRKFVGKAKKIDVDAIVERAVVDDDALRRATDGESNDRNLLLRGHGSGVLLCAVRRRRPAGTTLLGTVPVVHVCACVALRGDDVGGRFARNDASDPFAREPTFVPHPHTGHHDLRDACRAAQIAFVQALHCAGANILARAGVPVQFAADHALVLDLTPQRWAAVAERWSWADALHALRAMRRMYRERRGNPAPTSMETEEAGENWTAARAILASLGEWVRIIPLPKAQEIGWEIRGTRAGIPDSCYAGVAVYADEDRRVLMDDLPVQHCRLLHPCGVPGLDALLNNLRGSMAGHAAVAECLCTAPDESWSALVRNAPLPMKEYRLRFALFASVKKEDLEELVDPATGSVLGTLTREHAERMRHGRFFHPLGGWAVVDRDAYGGVMLGGVFDTAIVPHTERPPLPVFTIVPHGATPDAVDAMVAGVGASPRRMVLAYSMVIIRDWTTEPLHRPLIENPAELNRAVGYAQDAATKLGAMGTAMLWDVYNMSDTEHPHDDPLFTVDVSKTVGALRQTPSPFDLALIGLHERIHSAEPEAFGNTLATTTSVKNGEYEPPASGRRHPYYSIVPRCGNDVLPRVCPAFPSTFDVDALASDRGGAVRFATLVGLFVDAIHPYVLIEHGIHILTLFENHPAELRVTYDRRFHAWLEAFSPESEQGYDPLIDWDVLADNADIDAAVNMLATLARVVHLGGVDVDWTVATEWGSVSDSIVVHCVGDRAEKEAYVPADVPHLWSFQRDISELYPAYTFICDHVKSHFADWCTALHVSAPLACLTIGVNTGTVLPIRDQLEDGQPVAAAIAGGFANAVADQTADVYGLINLRNELLHGQYLPVAVDLIYTVALGEAFVDTNHPTLLLRRYIFVRTRDVPLGRVMTVEPPSPKTGPCPSSAPFDF